MQIIGLKNKTSIPQTFTLQHKRPMSSTFSPGTANPVQSSLKIWQNVTGTVLFFLHQLPAEVLGILPFKPVTFKNRVKKVIIELN